MNPQRRQVGRRFLCVLVAALVSLLLVVLPFAQTLDASDSSRDSGGAVLQDSGAPDFEYDDADIIVKANLSGNTKIPADAELCVEPITQDKDSAAYQDVETQVNKDVTADHQTVTGFRAYDIYFSGNGTRYEPEAGDATITIQYRDRVFDSAVKKATDEIKVLHLKKSKGKTQVENVTKAVDVKDLGGDKAKKTNSSSEAIFKDNGKDGSENPDGDTVEFQTKSFSTFVVTGVTGSGTINAAMSFLDASGIVDQTVSGTYYLYIECSNYTSNSTYRNTLKLDVSKGTASASLTGLYNQSGQRNSLTGNLYPLINSSSSAVYTAILFTSTHSVPLDGSFQWNSSTMTTANGYTKYEPSSVIANAFLLNYIPTVTVSNGSGTLAIAATAKTASISADDIMRWLTPTLPFGAFTNYIHLQGDNESCFAANKADLQHGDIGNSQNDAKYYAQTSNTINQNTITVKKIYTGSSQKTFRFVLYKNGSPVMDEANKPEIKVLTLSGGTQVTGTVTFSIPCITKSSDFDNYSVYELDSSGNKLVKNKPDSIDGYTLTDSVTGAVQFGSATTLNSTSYINSFDPASTGGKLKEPDVNNTPQNHLVIGTNALTPWNGSIATRNTYGFTIPCGDNSAILYSDNGTCEYASAANPMPDFSSILDQMAILSTELAQVTTNSSTVTVKKCDSDKLSSLNKGDFSIPSGSGNILLINIDATNSGSTFDITTAIRDHDVWAFDSIDKSWVPTAGNVVVNIYKRVGDSCVPYDGTISNACLLYGTILAPRATIHTSAVFNGRLIGNEVYNDGNEIHSIAPGVIASSRTDTFTNTEYVTPYTLPETGGGGTAIFYTTGGAVLLFGSVLAYAYRLSGKRRHIRKRRHKSLNE
jgi:hypothetical protein